MPDYEERTHFIINTIFIGLIAVIVFMVLRVAIPYTLPALIGLLIAFVLKPVTAVIVNHTPFKRRAVSLAVIAAFYLILTAVLFTLCALAFTQLGKLLVSLPDLYSQGLGSILSGVNSLLYRFFTTLTPTAADEVQQILNIFLESMQNAVGELSAAAGEWIVGAIRGLPMFCTTLLFTVMSSILISADYAGVTRFILRQLPPKYRYMALDAKDYMIGSLFKMLKAYTFILLITMIELSIGLWILDVDLFLAIGIIIALLDILPLIGTGGILIPWGLMELAQGDYFQGGGLLILFTVVTFVRNIIEPKIVGKQIGLHPVVTIAAMYLGLKLFGFLGLVFAPMAALLIKYLNDNGKIHAYR